MRTYVKQGIRNPYQDYHDPMFYLVTIVTRQRLPLFGACEGGRAVPNACGQVVERLWAEMGKWFPAVEPSTLVVMPDHLHGIVHVKERSEVPLGVAIRKFKSLVTSELRRLRGDPVFAPWEPGYHDRCVWRRDALPAFVNYIRENPRRYTMLHEHPTLFTRANELRHARLPSGETWHGYGNLFLLDRPECETVRVSRCATDEEIRHIAERAVSKAEQGVAILSPFISEGERTVAREVLSSRSGALIILKPDGFAPYFKPLGRYFDFCAEGRLLLLSACPPAGEKRPLTREQCLRMNAWCAAIAERWRLPTPGAPLRA